MKYNDKEFFSAVSEYKKILKDIKGNSFLLVFDISNKKAFLSIAPLSRAVHELEADMHVWGIDKKSEALEALYDVWNVFEKRKILKSKKTQVLMEFIEEIEKKERGKFIGLFEKPDFIIEAGDGGFKGSFDLPFREKWYKEYRSNEIEETCTKIWREVYNLKKGEKVSIGFVLIQKDEMLGHPLEDYLDSYAITWHMCSACKDAKISLGATTQRSSMLDKSEDISELKAILSGCELCKDADEALFKKYKVLSNLLNLDRIKTIDASFFIAGKGYRGKHFFGEIVGYPSLNGKTRWQSPGQMIYKLDFYPQTAHDDRDPIARVGFTETLPLDIFLESCNVNWKEMRERNWKIKGIADKCKVIRVVGKEIDGLKTDFEVGLVKADGIHRWVRTSDTDVREKINSEYLRKTGIKGGTMANIPGGEAFVTPEYVKGTIVGDVVISIDQSYRLSEREPFVIKADGNAYTVISGPKEIVKKFNEKKREAWEGIINQEKYKSLPQDLIDMKKRNFNMINEFAINTNPSAKLCDYLIVNEKIARMIHIAMGSGFEPDRSTDYHTDVVIDSPRQKLDIYGIDENGKEHWIIRKGDFVV